MTDRPPSTPRRSRLWLWITLPLLGVALLVVNLAGAYYLGLMGKASRIASSSSGGTGASWGGAGWVACQSIGIYPRTGDPRTRRLARILQTHLQTHTRLPRVEIHPEGFAAGNPAPDYFITLALHEETVKGSPLDHEVKSHLAVEGGSAPFRASVTVDNFSPPVARLDLDKTFDYHDRVRWAWRAPLEAGLADAMEDLAEAIAKQLDARPPLPEMPRVLYGEPGGPPEFPFLKEFDSALIARSASFMEPVRAFWRVESDADAPAFFGHIRSRLEAEGWRYEGHDTNLRLTRGTEVLEGVRARRDSSRPVSAWDNPRASGPPYLIQYTRRMDKEAIVAALDELVAGKAPLETVRVFLNHVQPGHAAYVIGLLDALPDKTVKDLTDLFWLYRYQANDRDKAHAALRAATDLSWALRDFRGLRDSIASWAKYAGFDDLAQPLTREKLTDAGCVEIVSLDVERDIEPGQTLVFFKPLDDGDVLLLEITSEADPNDRELRYYISQKTRAGSSSNPLNFSPRGEPLRLFIDNSYGLHADYIIKPDGGVRLIVGPSPAPTGSPSPGATP